MGRVVVIVPTYNEAGNLPELVRRIRACTDSDVEILVVDDSPNDATTDAARRLRCEVIHRKHSRGLSDAIIEGIRHSQTEKIIVMDADLQHPPELLPKIIGELDSADFVVTDRTCREGSYNMDAARRLTAVVANLMAAPLLRGVRDRTTGYFGLRRSALPNDLGILSSRGFKIMLELLVKGNVGTISQVPLRFGKRRAGESKLKGTVITDYLLQLASLYFYKFRWLRFGVVGALGMLVGFPILYILTEFAGLFYLASAVVAIVCASTCNYFFNNLWTFREKRRKGRGHLTGWLNYQMLSAGGDGVYLGLLALLTSVLGIWYMLSSIISIATVFAFKYMFANKVIWRTRHA